jgi:hypothetical protein
MFFSGMENIRNTGGGAAVAKLQKIKSKIWLFVA